MNPSVSIIIANWNGRDLVRDAILSVAKHMHDIKYEIIVVDDCSTDGSVEMIRDEFPEIKLIVNKKNLGFAKSNNRGVQFAKGEYILLLNSDTRLMDNSIKELVYFLKMHPDVGVCGAWLRKPDMRSQVSYGDFPSFHQALVDALFLNDIFRTSNFPNRGRYPIECVSYPIEVDYVTGAVLLTRKEIIDSVGLFDENFIAYCEDSDFCYRVKHQLGMKIYFVPNTQIIHLGGSSYGNGKERIRLMYSSYDKFMTKYHGKVYSFCTRSLYTWHYFVKMLVRCMIGGDISGAWYNVRYGLFPKF